MRAKIERRIVKVGSAYAGAALLLLASASARAGSTEAELEQRVRALERKLELQERKGQGAASLAERVSNVEQEVRGARERLSELLGVELHGFVAGSYNYNTNRPDSKANGLAVFHPDANSFQLDQFNLRLSRTKAEEPVGFVANLDFGKVAEVVGGVTNWSNSSTTERTNSVELREAFLTYRLPVGEGLVLTAGKFVTRHGMEIIENYDGHNLNITRSFNFGFGIPFTHTGIMLTVPFNSVLTVDLGVVNGWDNVVDNNDGKSVHGGISLTPSKLFSAYIAGIYGPEQNNNGHSKRGLTTVVLTLKPHELVTLNGELTYGSEEDAKFTDPTATAEWYGGAAYATLQLNAALQFVLRGEVFDDTDGSRFALASAPTGITAWSITPTIAYQVSDGLLWRIEYRHDQADKKVFDHDGNLNRGQDQILSQLIYSF